MSSQSPHHHLQGDDAAVIQAAHAVASTSTTVPPAVTSASGPHLVPPAVSPNVASVVPAIPISQPATNVLFDDTDPFAVHVNQHVDNDNSVAKNDETDAVVNDAHAHVDSGSAQQVEVSTAFTQHQDPDPGSQNPSTFNVPTEHHDADTAAQNTSAFNPDMQTNADNIVTSMPVVSQDMNQIPVSLSGTAHADTGDTNVPMVTVTSESMGIGNVSVSGAMASDIYTSTAGSVVVSAAQLTNAHNQPFAGMEYMASPTTDQPQQQMAVPNEHVASNTAEAQNFSVGPIVDDGTGAAPKFQDEVVNVVAALPGSEGVNVHASVNSVNTANTVPVVTSVNAMNTAQPPVNVNVNTNMSVMPNPAEIPYGGETVDKCVECEVCGSLFGDAGSLKRHAARAHKAPTGKGPVFCSQCSASLKNEQNLRRHIAVCHSGSQENRCNMCSASFSSRGSLRIHQQTVHSAPPPASKSGGRTGAKGTGLPGRPRGIVKPKAEKSYLCDMCTDTFKWKGNLKRHRELRHLQLRPFECHICHASFGTKSNMRVHLITHQNNGTGVTPQMPK